MRRMITEKDLQKLNQLEKIVIAPNYTFQILGKITEIEDSRTDEFAEFVLSEGSYGKVELSHDEWEGKEIWINMPEGLAPAIGYIHFYNEEGEEVSLQVGVETNNGYGNTYQDGELVEQEVVGFGNWIGDAELGSNLRIYFADFENTEDFTGKVVIEVISTSYPGATQYL